METGAKSLQLSGPSQWVPGVGLVSLDESVPITTDAQAPVVVVAKPVDRAVDTSAHHLRVVDATKPLTGREIRAMAVARVREISRILRAMPQLEAERDQLTALILAASPHRKTKRAASGDHH